MSLFVGIVSHAALVSSPSFWHLRRFLFWSVRFTFFFSFFLFSHLFFLAFSHFLIGDSTNKISTLMTLLIFSCEYKYSSHVFFKQLYYSWWTLQSAQISPGICCWTWSHCCSDFRSRRRRSGGRWRGACHKGNFRLNTPVLPTFLWHFFNLCTKYVPYLSYDSFVGQFLIEMPWTNNPFQSSSKIYSNGWNQCRRSGST